MIAITAQMMVKPGCEKKIWGSNVKFGLQSKLKWAGKSSLWTVQRWWRKVFGYGALWGRDSGWCTSIGESYLRVGPKFSRFDVRSTDNKENERYTTCWLSLFSLEDQSQLIWKPQFIELEYRPSNSTTVAQLVRAPPWHGGGRWFESTRSYQFPFNAFLSHWF